MTAADDGALLPSEEQSIADAVVDALRKKKRKKKRPGSIERAGRWEMWRLPWDSDPSVDFQFPRLSHVYRIASVGVAIGPIVGPGVRAAVRALDGANNVAWKISSELATTTSGETLITFAPDLPAAVPSLDAEPFPYTQTLPQSSIILPTMRWLIGLSAATLPTVRGVSVLIERAE